MFSRYGVELSNAMGETTENLKEQMANSKRMRVEYQVYKNRTHVHDYETENAVNFSLKAD